MKQRYRGVEEYFINICRMLKTFKTKNIKTTNFNI